MAATLHVLRPQAPPLAGFLRLGHTGHRKLADLHAAGRFPFRRIVVDAAHLAEQRDLLKTLKAAGCEIVLDPNVAEMATAGRFGSSTLQKLAWSNPDRPWEPSDSACAAITTQRTRSRCSQSRRVSTPCLHLRI